MNIESHIENYLAPLTNNERAVLFYAAGLRKWRVERTEHLMQDLSKWQRRRVKVSSAQVDKAVGSLLAKGYITMEPKRGNYFFPNRYWSRFRAHNGSVATMISVFRQKMAGMHNGIDWLTIADLKTVQPVFDLVVAYRKGLDVAELESKVREAERVALRQKELESAMLRMCEQYVARFSGDSPIRNQSDESLTSYMPYECDDLVSNIKYAARDLEGWVYNRRDAERDGERAANELSQVAA